MKNCHKAAENTKINAVFNTHKQLLVFEQKHWNMRSTQIFSDSSRDKEHVDVQHL